MRPAYVRPDTVEDAIEALSSDVSAAPLAGGTDLINDMRLGRSSPSLVVDIVELPELGEITLNGGIRFGSTVTMRAALSSPELQGRLDALHDAMRLLGGPQMQAVATLGGNVCHASPAAETATPLLAHGALAELTGPGGTRSVPLTEFWTGPGANALGRGELLRALLVPSARAHWVSAYERLELRHSVDIAVVGASAAIDARAGGVIRDAAVAIGAVASTPLLVSSAADRLLGATIAFDPSGRPAPELARAIDDSAQLCAAAARPITDLRASAAYRTAIVAVVSRRAILKSARRWAASAAAS